MATIMFILILRGSDVIGFHTLAECESMRALIIQTEPPEDVVCRKVNQ